MSSPALGEPKGRYGGPGYWVVVPFQTEAGWIVFVNRGFVPQGPEGPGTATGKRRARGNPDAGGYDPPRGNGWRPRSRQNRKRTSGIAAIRRSLPRAAGLSADAVAPYTVDLNASMTLPGGLPQPGETMVTFNNPHLGYAMTWYGLAAAAMGVFAVFAFGRLKRAD